MRMTDGAYSRRKEKGRKKDVEKEKRKRQSRPDPRIAKGEFSKKRSTSYKHELTKETLFSPLKKKFCKAKVNRDKGREFVKGTDW